MTRRKKKDYVRILKLLSLTGMNLKLVLTDFEKAEMIAFTEVFKHIRVRNFVIIFYIIVGLKFPTLLKIRNCNFCIKMAKCACLNKKRIYHYYF